MHKLLLTFAALGLICHINAQVVNSGLVAEYNFTGASLLADTGNVNGASHFINSASDRFGCDSNAISFDRSSNSYVSLGDNFDTIITGPNKKFSFSLWFKNADLLNSNALLMAKYGGSPCNEDGRQFAIRINNDQKIEFMYFLQLSHTEFRGYEGHMVINDTNWHHVVVNYDGTNNSNNGMGRVEIFVDTVPQILSLTISKGLFSGSYIKNGQSHFGLGAPLSKTGNFCFNEPSFHGRMDDIRIYSRRLAQSEISDLYNDSSLASCPSPPAPSYIIAQYNFTNTSLIPDIGNVTGTPNAIMPASDRFGCKSNAISFDRSSNSYVSLGDNFDNALSGPDKKFSFSLWFKNADLLNSNALLMAKYGGSPCNEDGRQFAIRINNDQKIEFMYFLQLSHTEFRGYEGHMVINDTNWHHVVVNYDGTNNSNNGMGRVEIFVDTVPQILSLTISKGLFSGSYIKNGQSHFGLGAPLSKTGNFCFNEPSFHGRMDDILLFAKNLSPGDISMLFTDSTSASCMTVSLDNNALKPETRIFPNPTASYFQIISEFYSFDQVIIIDGSGKILKDFAGNFNSETKFDIGDLPKGIYSIVLQSERHSIHALLLVKN